MGRRKPSRRGSNPSVVESTEIPANSASESLPSSGSGNASNSPVAPISSDLNNPKALEKLSISENENLTNPFVQQHKRFKDKDGENHHSTSEIQNNNILTESSDPQLTSADYYFDSYAHFGIHEEMLKDTVRTKTYQSAIFQSLHFVKDKVVLDVGAGTGILSLFCAKAGAKHVYAIECSDIADCANEIIKTNGYSNLITVIKGKVEEVSLPVKVDVIISEWMGYFLLYESMLDSVLYARDKWLKSDGIMMPDQTSLYLVAIEDEDYKHEKIHFWESVYGFDMSCIKRKAMNEPLVDTVDPKQAVTDTCLVKTINCETIEKSEASFSAPFTLHARRNDFIHAFVAYFDVVFTHSHKRIGFSTGPNSHPTHWKQTVLYLDDVITICEGETIEGMLTVSQNKNNHRDLDITIQYKFQGERCQLVKIQHYLMR